MTKTHTAMFSALFGFKNKKESEKITPVVVSQYSQPHVLQHRMKEENLTHGDRVIANITPVRLEENFGKMVIYFCPIQTINICKKIEDGDGGSLPIDATVNGLEVKGKFPPGLYNLKNVELFSNGTLQVIAGKDTVFEAV